MDIEQTNSLFYDITDILLIIRLPYSEQENFIKTTNHSSVEQTVSLFPPTRLITDVKQTVSLFPPTRLITDVKQTVSLFPPTRLITDVKQTVSLFPPTRLITDVEQTDSLFYDNSDILLKWSNDVLLEIVFVSFLPKTLCNLA